MGKGREKCVWVPASSQADEELSPELFGQVEMPKDFVSQNS